jgi:hypothetical protein
MNMINTGFEDFTMLTITVLLACHLPLAGYLPSLFFDLED